MIYAYYIKGNNILPINKQTELKDAYILIDYNLEQSINKININQNSKKLNIVEFLKQDINLSYFKNIKFFNQKDKGDNNIELPKIVLLELEEKIGIIKLLTLKNEVYILEKFFSNISIKMEKEIIFKADNYYKIFKQNEVYKIDNPYRLPKYKLWEYNNEYEIIFFEK